jgi:4-amino-4-deoxy-L-arabinose transferase-like glycosyltransferase
MLKKLYLDLILPKVGNFYSYSFLFFTSWVLVYHTSWVPGMFMDGTLYATLAKNAAVQGNWFVPFFQAGGPEKFFEHPPFIFIFQGVLFKLFGVSWSVARLGNFIFVFALISLLWRELKKLKGKEFAYLSCLILLLTLPFLKKSRFPNMDIPLTFFTALTLFSYLKSLAKQKFSSWLLTGVFFGLALLMKGHPAFIIPAIIFFHLIGTGQFRQGFKLGPWVSLVTGLLIFSLWPLTLALKGQYLGFELWFDNQFTKTVIQGRGLGHNDIFVYFKLLLKYCLPWFALTIVTTYRRLNGKLKEPLLDLALTWFWTVLILMSIPTWKLSHYILPLYPAMAILTTYALIESKEVFKNLFVFSTRYLIILTALVLLAFPLTTQTRRDKQIYQVINTLKQFKERPEAWGMIGSPYDYWSLSSAVAFSTGLPTYSFPLEQLEERRKRKSLIIIIKPNNFKKLKLTYPSWEKVFFPLYSFPEFVVLIDWKIVGEDFLFTKD